MYICLTLVTSREHLNTNYLIQNQIDFAFCSLYGFSKKNTDRQTFYSQIYDIFLFVGRQVCDISTVEFKFLF